MSEFQQPQQLPMNPKEAKARAKAAKAYSKASRPFYKKPWFIVLAVLVALGVIIKVSGGGSSTDAAADAPSFPSASAGESSAAESPAAPAGPTFAGQQDGDVSADAGGTIDLGGVTLTATPLVDAESFGAAVTCSTITMQNGTDEAVNFGVYDWSLQDPNGAIRDFTINQADDSLDSGDLAAGGNVSGSVCFEAEAGVSGTFVLFYEPTFSFSSDRAAWVNVR